MDWLASAGGRLWQVLPVGPVGYGESPYQLFSAFAGNPMLISPEILVKRKLLKKSDLNGAPPFPVDRVDFEAVIPWRTELLRRAFERSGGSTDLETPWLDEYARFMALKTANGGRSKLRRIRRTRRSPWKFTPRRDTKHQATNPRSISLTLLGCPEHLFHNRSNIIGSCAMVHEAGT